MINDETLMMQYRDGNANAQQLAFEQLYARHKGSLYCYLFRQTGDQGVAEDLFQEIWVNLIKARERYEHKAKFSTYLFRIAHNRLIDYYRSKKNAIPVSYHDDHDPELLEANDINQPDKQAEITGKINDLVILLEKLPEAQREVFLLKEESGMTLEEIAEVTGMNKETVKSRLRYAVKKLRTGMRKDHE